MARQSISIALAGSGGAGALTAGALLAEAAGRSGWYALAARSVGAQIRGGETVSMLRIGCEPVECLDDVFDILLVLDWRNLARFADETPLTAESLIICDPDEGEPPPEFLRSGARVCSAPLKNLARQIEGGRPNMIALGLAAALIGAPPSALAAAMASALDADRLPASLRGVACGARAASEMTGVEPLAQPLAPSAARLNMTGNEAAAIGAVRGGVRFVAGYPITPATELLECLAPMMRKSGGVLIQAEDELSCINQIIGASFGGEPSLTATAGPGLSLMMESIGLAVASETPLVVVDVMRGGPSTGIPAKCEQSDLNIAVYGLHGDAPHLVLAPNSTADCMFTTQWAVRLAEKLQTAAIVLSDQTLGQTRSIIDRPAPIEFLFARETVHARPEGGYHRYAITESGISPMAIPGATGCQYTADGLEHTTTGAPSSLGLDHLSQSDKRARKLTAFDYGDAWADVEGDGDIALLTWGSCTGAAREARRRLSDAGAPTRLVSVRLLSPICAERLDQALDRASRILVIELNHGAQFYHHLRAQAELTRHGREVRVLHRPGPLTFRPGEIVDQVLSWKAEP